MPSLVGSEMCIRDSLWTLPFCSLARISPTICSVASLPIESTPLFFLGWHLNGVGPLPPPVATIITARRQGPPLGRRARDTCDGNPVLRAEDAVPRSNAPRDSGGPRRVHPKQEARLVGPALCQLLGNTAEEPTQASTSRLVRDTPACCAFANLAHCTALRAASASLGAASAPVFGASDQRRESIFQPILPTRCRRDFLETSKAPTYPQHIRLKIVVPD